MLSINEAEERSKKFIKNTVSDFKIFIDTCSLLSAEADMFWANICPILQRENKSIVIPYRVYEELQKFAGDPSFCARKRPNNPELNQLAINARNNVAILQKSGLVKIYGDANDNFADNVFQTVFTKFRLKYNLLLITQDNNLASDIFNISKSKSVNTNNRILVERINKYGFLSAHSFEEHYTNLNNIDAQSKQYLRKKDIEIPDKEKFSLASTIQMVKGDVSISYIPKEGDMVQAKRENQYDSVKLEKLIATGGEGHIFATDQPNIVAKIYKSDKISKTKYEKLKLMITKPINCSGVCFPLAIIYNSKNEFVGYLMEKASGDELGKSVFQPMLLKKKFPDWKKIETVQLCITILKKIVYLHERNIILGDINPSNILVISPNEIYFVDTDSYQIEGFSCPVGTINFTAPEIQRKKYETFLRSMENEYFAVATLLFMIMLPGKPPYSLQGGESQIINIENGDFAYASGDRTTGKAPAGMWRYCWSHLPRFLKDDFYETFRKDGKHNTEKTRYSTSAWLGKFENYMELLKSGKLIENDKMSMDLFPTRFKKHKDKNYIDCILCHKEAEEERMQQGICQDCLKKGEIYNCAKCGDEMFYTNYQKHIKGTKKYEICKDCNDERKVIYARHNCVNCGEYFEITYGEKEFYDAKGYELPKKCKDCRGNNSANSSSNESYSSDSTFTDESINYRSLCFITTAVCEYLNKPDDCYELTTLREFRDNWLAVQPSGKEVINEYYNVAPRIVTALNFSEEKDSIYSDLWSNYISPCITLIENKSYVACRDLYMKMVNNLKSKLIKE